MAIINPAARTFRVEVRHPEGGKSRYRVWSCSNDEQILRMAHEQGLDVISAIEKPGLLTPFSKTASTLLGIFYFSKGFGVFVAAFVVFQWLGNFGNRRLSLALALMLALLGVAWVRLVVVVIRYAFFVFPWERETRRCLSTQVGDRLR